MTRRSAVAATIALAAGLVLAACGGAGDAVRDRVQDRVASRAYEVLREDVLINADLWADEPMMMAAGLGFTEIIGVPGMTVDDLGLSESLARAAGGTWNTLVCGPDEEPSLGNYTSAATPEAIATFWGEPVERADGLPVEFSWPVLPSTVDPEDFEVVLNDGRVVTPLVASIWPNFEYNERSVVVLFGHFGDRTAPDEPGATYPTRVQVRDDDETSLQLVGPGPEVVSAAGLGVDTGGSPYTDPDVPPEERGGPRLVAAKLSRFTAEGDTGPRLFRDGLLPNDGASLYGDRAQYRLRTYTSGGMTADGVRGVFPTDYSRFFRVHVEGDDGSVTTLDEAGRTYVVDGAELRVEGLADLGVAADAYTDCYREDRDNYIDIILSGDEAAARKVVAVEIPSTGAHDPLYNPGGPGNDPSPDVRYTAPSPPILQDVIMAIDDPMTVTYPADAAGD